MFPPEMRKSDWRLLGLRMGHRQIE
jgi:hypothetical protein